MCRGSDMYFLLRAVLHERWIWRESSSTFVFVFLWWDLGMWTSFVGCVSDVNTGVWAHAHNLLSSPNLEVRTDLDSDNHSDLDLTSLFQSPGCGTQCRSRDGWACRRGRIRQTHPLGLSIGYMVPTGTGGQMWYPIVFLRVNNISTKT